MIAHRNFEKFKQSWSPEVQRIFNEHVDLIKGLTRAEMKQMLEDIKDRARYAMKENEIRTLWQAILAIQIQYALENGDINRVHELLTDSITQLKEAFAEGRFKGSDWEKVADSMVSKMEKRTNSPTTGRTEPPEARASGVQ